MKGGDVKYASPSYPKALGGAAYAQNSKIDFYNIIFKNNQACKLFFSLIAN